MPIESSASARMFFRQSIQTSLNFMPTTRKIISIILLLFASMIFIAASHTINDDNSRDHHHYHHHHPHHHNHQQPQHQQQHDHYDNDNQETKPSHLHWNIEDWWQHVIDEDRAAAEAAEAVAHNRHISSHHIPSEQSQLQYHRVRSPSKLDNIIAASKAAAAEATAANSAESSSNRQIDDGEESAEEFKSIAENRFERSPSSSASLISQSASMLKRLWPNNNYRNRNYPNHHNQQDDNNNDEDSNKVQFPNLFRNPIPGLAPPFSIPAYSRPFFSPSSSSSSSSAYFPQTAIHNHAVDLETAESHSIDSSGSNKNAINQRWKSSSATAEAQNRNQTTKIKNQKFNFKNHKNDEKIKGQKSKTENVKNDDDDEEDGGGKEDISEHNDNQSSNFRLRPPSSSSRVKYVPKSSIASIQRLFATYFMNDVRSVRTNRANFVQLKRDLRAKFIEYGLKTGFQRVNRKVKKMNSIGHNLIGIYSGAYRNVPHRDSVLVLGAHYDTVPGSTGIEDNASGSVAIMEVARVLHQHRCVLNTTIIFVLFDMEEDGLVGSKAFVRDYLYPIEIEKRRTTMKGAIVIDMLLEYDSTAGSQSTKALGPVAPKWAESVRKNDYRADFAAVWARRDTADTALFKTLQRNWKTQSQSDAAQTDAAKYKLLIIDPQLPANGLELTALMLTDKMTPPYRTFLRSDHSSFWYPHAVKNSTIPAILLTDLGPWRRRVAAKYHTSADNDKLLTKQNLLFLKHSIDSLLRTVLDIGGGRCESPPANSVEAASA